jgi:predicted DsbA family dithiol-disulfide isomerase
MGDSGRHGAGGRTADAPPPKPRILVWFDYACPLCFVDRFRFDELRRRHDIEVVDVPLELREMLPPEGISASAEGLTHSEHYEAHLAKEAAAHGVAMRLPDLIPNTHRALIAGEVARDAGSEEHRRLGDAVFSAYFGEERDIGDPAVLLDVVAGAGIDPASVEAAWGSERYEQRLHSFRHLAIALGVTATPAALICNELMLGSRPLKVLEAAVARCLSAPPIVAAEAERDGVQRDSGAQALQ